MENVFIYFIKASGLIGIFYLAYVLLLRKETFFNGNRWFLLSGLITAAILPLVVFTKIVWVEPTTDTLDWSNIPVTTMTINPDPQIDWYLIASYVYLIGTVIFLIKLLFDFYSLSKVFKGQNSKHQGNFKLIDVNENIAPFSFFKSIVYNSALYTPIELENILEHEKVHSSQHHSVDVLVARLFCIAFWFNPLIWLYKKAIIQNLEFIADGEASKKIADKKAYQLTLLKITTQDNCVAISNHFYQSLIKKRIIMLNQNQSKKWNSWKYVTVFPALIAFVFLFQIEVVAQEKEVPKQEKETKSESDDLKPSKIEKDLKTLSENKEIIINGEKSNQEELDKLNPDNIEKIDVATISGKKTILVTTKKHNNKTTIKVTDKDIYINGAKSTKEELDKLTPKEIETIDVIEDKKEIRIFTKDWLKKSKEFTFYIDDKKVTPQEYYSFNPEMIECSHGNINEKTIKITTKNKGKLDDKNNVQKTIKNHEAKPLIIIDGVKQASNFKIEEIPTDHITKIDVLKGISAITQYGENGKNGVIQITTKEKTALKSTYISLKDPVTRNPIIIINGIKTNSISNINEINPDAIESMNVLKGKNATGKYGDAGKYGVIEITTKIDDPSKLLKTPKDNNNDWITTYDTFNESNIKNKIIENKSVNYKKAVIVINGKQSDYQTLEKLDTNEIEFAMQADIKKASEENQKKAIQLYGKNALNGFIQIRTKNP